MKILNLILLLFTPYFLFSCQKEDANDSVFGESNQTTFYINTQEDFDKWNNFNFPAGSKVLFAAGKTFAGEFILRGSGTETSTNIAAAYNSETLEVYTKWIDNKPLIQGQGKVS